MPAISVSRPMCLITIGWLFSTVSAADLERGRQAYQTGQCFKCHGEGGSGTQRGPRLADQQWAHCDGSVEGILGVLQTGVPEDQVKDSRFKFGMNPATERISSPEELQALAEYVHSLGKGPGAAGIAREPVAAGTIYEDADYKFKLPAPEGWMELPAEGLSVPGKVRKGWSPDGTASVVVFMQEPGQALTPRALLDVSVAGVKKLGVEVKRDRIGTIGGKRAMHLVVAGKGTGGALTGQGDVATVQEWVAIPRATDIVVVLLTAPEADHEKHSAVFRGMLKGIQVEGEQDEEQKNSK